MSFNNIYSRSGSSSSNSNINNNNIMYDSSKTIILDIQFVVGNKGQYFAKEIAYVNANSIVHNHLVFKAPFDYRELDEQAKKQNTFNVNNINQLRWDQGKLAYSEVSNLFWNLRNYTTIIVKGRQKKDFLLKYFNNNINNSLEIVDLDIGTSLSNIPNKTTDCYIHSNGDMRCAINNVYKILFYLNKNNLLLEK